MAVDPPRDTPPGAAGAEPLDDAGAGRGLEVLAPLSGSMAALVELAEAVPVDLTDGEVADGVLALVKLHGQIEAALAGFVAAFDTRALATVDGVKTTATWVAGRAEVHRERVSDLVQTGRDLRHCPRVAEAFADGVLGPAKVRYLLEARKRVEAQFADHEETLVRLLRPLTVKEAKVAVAAWRRRALVSAGLDPDDKSGAADDDDVNSVHLSQTFGGRWALSGDLDAVSGQALANAIDAIVEADFRAGRATASDGIPGSKRKADALALLVERGARPGTHHGEQRPSVHLIWDADHLLGREAADAAEALRRRCHLAGGAALRRSVAERLLCTADVTDVLVRFGLDGTSEVLGVTHTHRLATVKERKALRQRDRGCVFPGCDAPVDRCQAHHTIPYELGRHTMLDELVLLCPTHHRCVHEGGFHLVRHAGSGRIEVHRPDGTPLPAPGWGRQVPPGPTGSDPPPVPLPGSRSPALTRPHSRFATLTERLDAEEREIASFRPFVERGLAQLRAEAAAHRAEQGWGEQGWGEHGRSEIA